MTESTSVSAPATELLLSIHRQAFEEMSWRRNAGYRTIIIGFGYFTLLIALVAFNRAMPFNVRVFIAA